MIYSAPDFCVARFLSHYQCFQTILWGLLFQTDTLYSEMSSEKFKRICRPFCNGQKVELLVFINLSYSLLFTSYASNFTRVSLFLSIYSVSFLGEAKSTTKASALFPIILLFVIVFVLWRSYFFFFFFLSFAPLFFYFFMSGLPQTKRNTFFPWLFSVIKAASVIPVSVTIFLFVYARWDAFIIAFVCTNIQRGK